MSPVETPSERILMVAENVSQAKCLRLLLLNIPSNVPDSVRPGVFKRLFIAPFIHGGDINIHINFVHETKPAVYLPIYKKTSGSSP